jgi:hypothetical protein
VYLVVTWTRHAACITQCTSLEKPMRVADLKHPVVFHYCGKDWVSSCAHTQADTMLWCLELQEGHLMQIPMEAEVVVNDHVHLPAAPMYQA